MFSLGKFVFKVIMKLYNNHDEKEEGVGSNVSGCGYLPPNSVVSVSCT